MGSGSRIVLVTGTGTEVGKTHVAAALLGALGETLRAIGYKPVETGVPGGSRGLGEDARELARASTFHVKHPVFRQTFREPISPHLAARRTRTRIDLDRIESQAHALARVADQVVVELAGGLFSPLGPGLVNADLVRRLAPGRILLVAPDRLGVLHDVRATLGAAGAMKLQFAGVVLSAPRVRDASTGTNARELERVFGVRVLAVFPRGDGQASVTRRAARALVRGLDLDATR